MPCSFGGFTVHLRLAERIGYAGPLHTMIEDPGRIPRATVLRRQLDKPGRPRLQRVLEHPDTPHLEKLIRFLNLRP